MQMAEVLILLLIYGKTELSSNEKMKITSLENVEVYFCKNLHAKCYHNEETLIISSMNLCEFSERNNREMGMLIEKSRDSDIFNETLCEIESIKNASVKEKSIVKLNLDLLDDKSTFKLYEGVTQEDNFFLPKLYEALKLEYLGKNIVFNNSIEMIDFPILGIE